MSHLRISGGEHKGRKLVSPKGLEVRPTPQMAREAIFSILAAKVPGSSVLDLFSGTGSMGLEALSRGAQRVVFVEKAPLALSALRRNVQALRVEGAVRVMPLPVQKALDILREEGETFDLLLADPPYKEPAWATWLGKLAWVMSQEGVAVVEVEAKGEGEFLQALPPDLQVADRRRYGRGLFFFLVKE
ncbi:MAG: 16S rRNA (guanine(966)-N(2))-methyltransferase RsmD [Clostridiales bacterium]|nr:16S rRNA (guanine(966)-N(2))-methyltransferase RsmD [Clostridiales bacterium]